MGGSLSQQCNTDATESKRTWWSHEGALYHVLNSTMRTFYLLSEPTAECTKPHKRLGCYQSKTPSNAAQKALTTIASKTQGDIGSVYPKFYIWEMGTETVRVYSGEMVHAKQNDFTQRHNITKTPKVTFVEQVSLIIPQKDREYMVREILEPSSTEPGRPNCFGVKCESSMKNVYEVLTTNTKAGVHKGDKIVYNDGQWMGYYDSKPNSDLRPFESLKNYSLTQKKHK